MRKLTDKDMRKVIGMTNCGFVIEQARVKNGKHSDSDHYGIVLGKSSDGVFVTWEFHLEGAGASYYWGYYFDDESDAVTDYQTRI